ncbi:saxitoxin and tetrodotoxin-binding protein 1-like [Sparus aurata]|uniref:saxitoxin and tetrodotoxin-binding protein 1-like n=1 Tax=Sparus aurata TaxID=8175 RepID=UPI0011C18057|nr:saxitoxin and tetrodotoxin-binding protein 1-like [Sparus aurata]
MPAKTLSISCWNVASVSAVPEDCDTLKTLSREHLSQVLGDWVLVWSISNENKTSLLTNLTSSFVELQLTSDNSTLLFKEWNQFRDTSCSKYSMNLTMLSDASQKFELATSGCIFEENGVQTPYELTATVEFYETHKDCMTLFYKVTGGQYLLHYRREGRRQDAEQLVVVHDDHKKVAECLKFPFENPFIYDEAADPVLTCRQRLNPNSPE